LNPVYSILESPYSWLILAGISLGTAILGALMMIAYVWPHWLEMAWFYLGFALTLYCLGRWGLEWWRSLDGEYEAIQKEQSNPDRIEAVSNPSENDSTG
jgi:hypothetical protein